MTIHHLPLASLRLVLTHIFSFSSCLQFVVAAQFRALSVRAMLFEEQGNWEGTVVALADAHQMRPGSVDAAFNYVVALWKRN